jgi:hypothetical protein
MGLADVHRPEEQAIDRGEQGRVGADAECQRHEDDGRPRPAAEEHADGEAQIPEQRGHTWPLDETLTLPTPVLGLDRPVHPLRSVFGFG